MKLNYSSQGDGYPVILMHGMFGSMGNLGLTARPLADHFQVISVDMRNHGDSPHSPVMDYPTMATDIIELLDELGIQQAHLLGHSMGGKVAMEIALNYPARLNKLVVADISPVQYLPNRHGGVLTGLGALANARPESRQEADRLLALHVEEPGVRAFLLKNLLRGADGRFDLRLNLEAIVANYQENLTLENTGTPFDGPVLFIKGADSEYIQENHREQVQQLFPRAQLKVIANTGHWLHAEKPETFNKIVHQFLVN